MNHRLSARVRRIPLVLLVLSAATPASAASASAPIDRETLAKWSAPYRGWHYQPDHVIPAGPKIPGHEKFHNTDVPCIFQLPGQPDKWFMSFIAFDGQGYNSFVAESNDLVHWTKPRLAMGFGPKGEFDHGGSVIGAFLYESYDIKAPRLLKKRDGKCWSLYGCYPRQGGYELRPGYEGVACSEDGLTWRRAKNAPILAVQDPDCGPWEKDCIYQPWLVEERGRFFNFYNAANGGIEQTGLAFSTDLLNWMRYPANPVIANREGGYDAQFASDPKVFRDGDHWTMFYFGVGKGGAHIMIAFSRDLVHWTAHPEPLYKAGGNPTGLDKQYAHKISLVYNPKNETFYMYYCACGNKGRGIGLITSKPLDAAASPAGEVSTIDFDLETARLSLDSRGGIVALKFAGGTLWPGAGQPAFLLETDAGPAASRQILREGDRLRVEFENGAHAEFRVALHRSFALFRLSRLTSEQPVRRFRLFALPVPSEATRISTLGAAQTDAQFAAVMVAEPNVQTVQEQVGVTRGDRAGCSHQFVQQSDGEAKQGRYAAKFAATCDDKPGGWSVRGRSFPRAVDLTGCRAIRAWVCGDGQGQQLKIQLFDGRGGYRDDYIAIDFRGWRQVTLTKPALETLRYDHVAAVNFYYNGLPPNKTVSCLIDNVEATVMRQGQEQTILLEDFESPLWVVPGHSLQVQTVAAHGIEPAAFAVLACPRNEAMDTIRRFEEAAGLPSPRPGGRWNKTSPWIGRSYLFLTSFKESQFDAALAIARRGGFHTILLGQESWCRATGHYEINRASFPDGLDGLKRTIERFHAAGFRAGLHFLGPSIYAPDAYLTPVPDPRLAKGARAELATAVDASADFLPITAPPSGFPAEDGGYTGDGTVLQVEDELIRYARLSAPPKPGFTNCQRGYLGTRAAAHPKGTKVAHLMRSYGYHMFDMDTSLLDEVATRFARVANVCKIDMIYFDGSERLQGDHWHYNAKLHKAFYDKLENKDMLLQASSYSPYSWHILARTASADGHGDLKGYLDERSPWFDSAARGGMPLDIGWYYGYDPSATPDMYEYVLGATIGYNSSMSYQVSVDAFNAHPFAGEILDLIARYERLRLSGRVDEAMRQRLRIDPTLAGALTPEQRAKRLDRRREYRLAGTERQQAFQRVIYGEWHEIPSAEPAVRSWRIVAPMAGQVGVQIHIKGNADPKAASAGGQKELVDPYVEVAGQRFTWKGRLGVGQYATFWPGEPARRNAPHVAEPEAADIAKSVVVGAGEHRVSFGAAGGSPMQARVRVMLQPSERYPID